jgi:hypothetical protein
MWQDSALKLLKSERAGGDLATRVTGSNPSVSSSSMSSSCESFWATCRTGGKGLRSAWLTWEFECEPVQGWSRDGLVGYLDHAVKGMAARIEEAATADES